MREDEKMTVKESMQKEYEDYVSKNQDDYGNAVIAATANVAKKLDEGKSCEEAEKAMDGYGLSGFMAGCVASAIVHYHPRGEEFKQFWNKRCGGTGTENGTINPAIITIKS